MQYTQQFRLRAEARITRGQDVSCGPFSFRLQNRPLALVIEIAEEIDPVIGEVVEGDNDPGLFVIVVIAKGPAYPPDGRILPEPGARCFIPGKGAFFRIGAPAVAECLIEAADAVVGCGDEE